MLDRSRRFHGYNALNQAYKQGQTVRGSTLISLKYYVQPRRSNFRVAVVVSRKVSKSAVTRNRIRRRVYEIIRAQAEQISKPYDIILTVFSDTLATMEAVTLTDLVSGQLAQAGIVETTVKAGHDIVSTEGKKA